MVHGITKIPYNKLYGYICSLVSTKCSARLVDHMSLPARPNLPDPIRPTRLTDQPDRAVKLIDHMSLIDSFYDYFVSMTAAVNGTLTLKSCIQTYECVMIFSS